jgi:hypothetical protein
MDNINKFVKLNGKYVILYYYNSYGYGGSFDFELVDNITKKSISADKYEEYTQIRYLAKNKYNLLGEYDERTRKFFQYLDDKSIVIEKKFNDFVIEQCVEYEKFTDVSINE